MNPPAPRQQPPRPASRPGPNKRADRANNAPARDRTLSGPGGASRPGAGGQPVALWQQLEAVASALQASRAGQSGTAALAAVDTALRPGVQSLLFQVLRQAGRAEALRRQMVARTPPPAADALLCTALALCWNPEESPYEPFTLVNQVVEAAKRSASTRAQASFLNGCLRRFLREREALVARTDGDPLARWNHPVWWVERLRKDHPQHWEQILQANNAHAPMTLRVNAQKSTLALYQKALEAINLEAIPSGSVGLVLQHPVPVQSLPGFEEGWVSVQDAAAQMAAPLLLEGLDLTRPVRVLDACAAPGGKTAHLLEWAGAGAPIQVTALEIDATRSARIGETLQRLGARNILPASLGPFPKINPEFVVRAKPDIIMVGDSNFADMITRPGWQNMRAMRTQRVCHFKSEESDVLVRAGPRMAEAARLMAKCLTEKGQP